jgi:hypothetical protein
LYYTLPPSSISMDDFVVGPVFGILSCETKDSFIQDICNALIKRDILPVLPIAALQYCSRAYCQLTDNDELIDMLEDPDGPDELKDADSLDDYNNKNSDSNYF